MEYVIMKVKFEKDVDVDSIIAKFYTDNEKAINGMESDTLKDEQAWKDFFLMYKNFESI